MKSQLLILFFLTISAVLIQPTHQYRLSKRELTEYDLTNFIVGTCSADKIDMPIQNLCDQTLESALMGNFPFLTYYCKTLGAGMSYCNNINRHMIIDQNDEAKRFVYRRLIRSVNEDNNVHRKGQKMNTETDLEFKKIIQICITKSEKNSVDTDQFCNRTLEEIQKGRYPEIEHFCKYHPGFDYCQDVRSYSSSTFNSPLYQFSSLLSSATHSHIPNINPSFASSSVFKTSDIGSIINHQRNNKQKQQLSS